MGLDMYAYTTKESIPLVDFKMPEDGERLFYWRKHPNLHGWMQALYDLNGGTDDAFNCATVRLDLQHIDALERFVHAGALPRTTGFFFGESQPEHRDDDIAFIEAARKAIADGYAVFYYAWW